MNMGTKFYKRLRVIVTVGTDSDYIDVTFTEDMERPADSFTLPTDHVQVVSDDVLKGVKLPICVPMDQRRVREERGPVWA